MAEARACRHCGFAFYSNGRRMEVCWSNAKEAWLCLDCHLFTPTGALDGPNTDTPPEARRRRRRSRSSPEKNADAGSARPQYLFHGNFLNRTLTRRLALTSRGLSL